MGTEAGWYTRRKNKSEFEAALCEKAERYGEQRAVEGIARWLRSAGEENNPVGYDHIVCRDIAEAIERGEWKEEKP